MKSYHSISLLLFLIPVFALNAQKAEGGTDIGVIISTSISDSWELTGNMTIQKTTWKGVEDNPDMVFITQENNFDAVLAAEVDRLRTPDVPLASFSADMINEEVIIHWDAPLATLAGGFTVERSDDANTWQEIGTPVHSPSHSILQSYSFTDKTPLEGTNYYRLRQVTLEAEDAYSDIIAVENLAGAWHVTHLYPNPLIFGASIKLNLYQPDQVRITLSDLEGNAYGTVYSRYTSIGDHEIELDLDKLPKGEYSCRIEVGEMVTYRRIIK